MGGATVRPLAIGVRENSHGEVFLRQQGKDSAYTNGPAAVLHHTQAVFSDADVPADAIAASLVFPFPRRTGLWTRALHLVNGSVKFLAFRVVSMINHDRVDPGLLGTL